MFVALPLPEHNTIAGWYPFKLLWWWALLIMLLFVSCWLLLLGADLVSIITCRGDFGGDLLRGCWFFWSWCWCLRLLLLLSDDRERLCFCGCWLLVLPVCGGCCWLWWCWWCGERSRDDFLPGSEITDGVGVWWSCWRLFDESGICKSSLADCCVMVWKKTIYNLQFYIFSIGPI